MIGVVIPVVNGCVYCQTHHRTDLNNYWKDDSRIEQLKNNYNHIKLSEKEVAMCHFAVHLTKYTVAFKQKYFTSPLKDKGLDDAAILDVVPVTSYSFYTYFVHPVNVISYGMKLMKLQN
jgi:uncharacterized peroxidase-related enzyme